MCEPYLLREALRFVELINVNSHTYKLAYLHIKFPDSAVTNAIRRLCPDVKELVLEDQVTTSKCQLVMQ